MDYIGEAPSLEDYWRGIILFGKNVASYKFALAQSLLELAAIGKTHITLEELAEPYARHTVEHLMGCARQSQNSQTPYPFLEACRRFNEGQIERSDLIAITAKEGFKVVLDKFHNVNGELPIRFFAKSERNKQKAIALTDEIFHLLEGQQHQNLESEIEARWRLVETAWNLNISRNLIAIAYDPERELLFTEQRNSRRTDITSCRAALNGYQKGKCFYCFADISIQSRTDNLTDVDHFFPRVLQKSGIAHPIDGVWNLVLACQNCNRGTGGKFDRLPHQLFLKKLHVRNEFFISSHHPLRETLMQQTGESEPKRRAFLRANYQEAETGPLINSSWQPYIQYPPVF